MRNLFLNLLFILMLTPFIGQSENLNENNITLTVNTDGEVIAVDYAASSWNSGELHNNYLDFAHTQKTFKDIKLKTGKYEYSLTTEKRNNKQGKVNLSITAMYKGGSNSEDVSKKCSPGRTDKGQFILSDFQSKTSGTAGYGKVKIHIGRAGANTNVWYKITLARIGGACGYTSLGSKTGNIISNTTKKYTFKEKACKDEVEVTVTKTGGKARTTVSVYTSSTKNGAGKLKSSFEFKNDSNKKIKTFNLSGVENKFIRVEMHNRSIGNTFKYKVTATQSN